MSLHRCVEWPATYAQRDRLAHSSSDATGYMAADGRQVHRDMETEHSPGARSQRSEGKPRAKATIRCGMRVGADGNISGRWSHRIPVVDALEVVERDCRRAC